MALPSTYLCTAPSDLKDVVGQEMLSDDIIRGLRQINTNLCVPLPEHYDEWYPLQSAGITCLWIGKPGEGRKVTAFKLGAVPEFTQLSFNGESICKGWRAVFSKVISSGAATKAQIEAKFRISLTTDGADKSCLECRVQGKIKKATSKSGRCGACEKLFRFQQKLENWRAEQFEARTKPNVGRIIFT